MQRYTASTLRAAARGIHSMVFIEDHSIITGNKYRVDNLRQVLQKVEGKLKEDTCTVVKLNSGYYKPNEVIDFEKNKFDVEEAVDLKGNHGPSGIWGNISRVMKERRDGDISMLVLTNAAEDCFRNAFVQEYTHSTLGFHLL
ncbi:hypothetical protein DIPPA_16342 [Diplonema papillatum]|nr:hypothetical protein DIPPA_16342 [Diplonema papillatum]